MHLDLVNDLLFQYGLYAVFILVMLEGDITLLLAGVLAHSAFFGEYSFARVLLWGTIGGCLSDNIAYFAGRGFCEGVKQFRFYRAAQPRLQRLTTKFGPLSIFLSKYIYGLRWASCVFYGVGRMPYLRFLVLSFASCFMWVFVLAGAGYFFSGAVIGLIGDFQRLGKVLLVIVLLGIVAFYWIERFWLSPKVEKADPERLQELEQAATEKLQDLRHEFQEHIPFKHQRRGDKKPESDGD
ncbi:MAG TPA: DedA family protein [Pyrinomonadaceae bacterium]|jgi:membrane protein DedA with SNARE-associated domain|nr:DedA family protein [Pyrinomonadaceae bacterium]